MSFSVEEWKRQARQKCLELASWLKGWCSPADLVAYSGLTTFALWPLVEYVSAVQAGYSLLSLEAEVPGTGLTQLLAQLGYEDRLTNVH